MAFTVKATAISPKPFNVGGARRRIRKACELEGFKDAQELRKTTEGWDEPTPIGYEIEIKADYVAVWAGPKGPERLVEKWRRIDEPGRAERHPIVARNAPTLRFPWKGPRQSYDAKTKPGHFGRAGTGKKLGSIIRPKAVNHPGIYEPRRWSETLANRRIKPFADNIQNAINLGLGL